MINVRPHIPVLGRDVVDMLQVHENGTYIDGTLGACGYTTIMLTSGAGMVIGIDRDPNAIRDAQGLAEQFAGRLRLVHGQFGNLDSCLDQPASADGVALDLGVSSMQLDQAERGFSFMHDGPLDMRMSADGPSAADLVNETEERTLAEWLWRFGEERHSRRIARAIVIARVEQPLTRTAELAALVAKAMPRHDPHHHPATRTFEAVLKPGGRCVVVSFHSLEDRIVKNFFRDRSASQPKGSRHQPPPLEAETPAWRLLTRKPIVPGAAEIANNPRARSARLRAAERLSPDGREA
jgi:16S rRNA (cytosine1402-N4)-methyltransferase